MRPTVLTAREWVVRNQAGIMAACSGGAEEVGGRDRQADQAARVKTFGQPMRLSEESDYVHGSSMAGVHVLLAPRRAVAGGRGSART